jgi:predicted O-methyltransferase YrrM
LSFIRRQLHRIASTLLRFVSADRKKLIMTALTSVLQESMRGVTETTGQAAEAERLPYPVEISSFEKLYDTRTGGWHATPAEIRINVFEKELYPVIFYDSIELEVGHFYHAFIKLTRSSVILETGVSRGYSTCCIASALSELRRGGHVYAIDPADYPHLWEGTGLEPYISWLPKTSQDAAREVAVREYDLLIIDSHHDYDTCMFEVMNFEPLLKVNGYILMHDSLFYDGVGAVVKQLVSNPRFDVMTHMTPRSHGDSRSRCPGLTVVRKIAAEGPPIRFEEQFSGWYIGNQWDVPFLERK